MRYAALVLTLCASAATAQGYTEPARGTELRADLMDAIRPHAEWALGAPIQFVVRDLRVAGDVAFASLMAQRPGGGEIDMARTPQARRSGYDPNLDHEASIQALLRKSGDVWVAVHHGISPTDVWWSWDAYCPVWGPVLPEFCR